MKKAIIWLLTIVMASAFIGFIYVQITYMENMIEMRNAQFSESVMRSLNSVSQQLEQDETKFFLEEDIADLGVLYPNTTNSDFSYTIPTTDGSKQLLIKGNLNSIKVKNTLIFGQILQECMYIRRRSMMR